MNVLKLQAELNNLKKFMDYINEFACENNIKKELVSKIELVLEEVLVNIINYAYPGGKGEIELLCDYRKKKEIIIKICDTGIAFNPLEKEDPDVTLSVEERSIGGLGIYFMKELVDDCSYLRENGKNILTLKLTI